MIINQSFKVIVITLGALLNGCASSVKDDAYIPQNGDLAFQISEISDFTKAITDVSAMHDSIKFAHVGIVAIDNGKPCVIEAVPKDGVTITPFETYLSEALTIDGQPGVVIKRIRHDFPSEKAIATAKSFLGQEYDWNFLPDNGKIYCSELVYESFTDSEGNRLFQARPMNFRNAEGDIPVYWEELFKKLGTDVPQGIPGTSPQDMSQEPILEEVYSYF